MDQVSKNKPSFMYLLFSKFVLHIFQVLKVNSKSVKPDVGPVRKIEFPFDVITPDWGSS